MLEIAIGTGHNLPYSTKGAKLTGIELGPAMLEMARARAAELGVDVDLRLGDAQALPFPDGSFDAVVCTLSLCTFPDDRKAVQEVRRVLNYFSTRKGGDHMLREPLEHLRTEEFDILTLERAKLGIVERVVARK